MTVSDANKQLAELLPTKYFSIKFELDNHSPFQNEPRKPTLTWTIYDGAEFHEAQSLESALERVKRKHAADKTPPDTIETAETSLSEIPPTQPQP